MSAPASYVVHRNSQQSVDVVCAYLTTVHELINEAAEERILNGMSKL